LKYFGLDSILSFTDMRSLDFGINQHQLSKEITDLLNEDNINELAKEAGFIKRSGGKIDGFMFLDILLFTHFNFKELSLNDLAVQLKKRYKVVITKQSIDERFGDGAIVFFKSVLEKVLNISILGELEGIFTQYGQVRIKDSTSFQLPETMKDEYPGSGGSGSPACIRIQFEYDIKAGKILDLSLHAYTSQDATNAKDTIDTISSGDLVIRDLGYIVLPLLQQIEDKGAFYLNRLHSGTNVYEKNKDGEMVLIDFAKLHKQLKRDGIIRIEKQVYVGSKERFKTRMIIEVVPQQVYQERLRKAKASSAKRNSTVSEKHKATLGLTIFITNTDTPINEVRLLYTLRWQIELMFKIWKSIGEIDRVKKMKVERFEACLLAKLIWIALNWQIMRRIVGYFFNNKKIEISPYKLFKTLKASLIEFKQAIVSGVDNVISFIDEVMEISPINHLSEKKKNAMTWSYDVLRLF